MAENKTMSNEEMSAEIQRLRAEMNRVTEQYNRDKETFYSFVAALAEAQDFEKTMIEVESITKQITGCAEATLYCYDSKEGKFYTSNGDYRDWQDNQDIGVLREAMSKDFMLDVDRAYIPVVTSSNEKLGVIVADKKGGFEGIDFSMLQKGSGVSNIIDLAMKKELNHQAAITDKLTNMKNVDGLHEYVSSVMRKNLADKNKSVNILMCDIDHFKSINDTYGHKVGNIVLQNVAKELMEHTRGGDASFRIGGEEMVCVLNCDPIKAIDAAERLRAEIERTVMHTLQMEGKPHDIKVTISMGIHEMNPNQYVNKENAQQIFDAEFEAADKAVYAAKNTGRNRVVSSNENYMRQYLSEKTAEVLCGDNAEYITQIKDNVKSALEKGDYDSVIGAIEGAIDNGTVADRLPQAQLVSQQIQQFIAVTDYTNQKISETEKNTPTEFLDWSKFGEKEYNELVSAVQNKQNIDVTHVLHPTDTKYAEYQVDVNIKPFGKHDWALDCDVFKDEENGIDSVGYLGADLPDFAKFKAAIENNCKEIIVKSSELSITSEKAKTKKTIGNTDYKNIGEKADRIYKTVDSRHAYNVGKQLSADGIKWVGFVKDNNKTTIVINKKDMEAYSAANEKVKAMYDRKREAVISEAQERCDEGLKEVSEASTAIESIEQAERNRNATEI